MQACRQTQRPVGMLVNKGTPPFSKSNTESLLSVRPYGPPLTCTRPRSSTKELPGMPGARPKARIRQSMPSSHKAHCLTIRILHPTQVLYTYIYLYNKVPYIHKILPTEAKTQIETRKQTRINHQSQDQCYLILIVLISQYRILKLRRHPQLPNPTRLSRPKPDLMRDSWEARLRENGRYLVVGDPEGCNCGGR